MVTLEADIFLASLVAMPPITELRALNSDPSAPTASGTGGISRIPEGAWDSHIHVVDPSRYPLASDATYTPGIHTAWDNAIFENSINISRNTIVQPSIYGNDNTAVLQTLEAFGPERSRAVVVFDPADSATTTEMLQHWHSLGVRGVRVNLGFVGKIPASEEFKVTLKSFADAIRPLDWAMQMYIPMEMIGELEGFFPTLRVRIVFDHLGHPDMPECNDQANFDPYSVKGFQSLINLLKNGNTWVKISAPYRLSKSEGPLYGDLDPLIKEFFKTAPTRLVFASDWPHTLFEGLDIKPWVEHVLDLVGHDDDLRLRLFRDNAKTLWGANSAHD